MPHPLLALAEAYDRAVPPPPEGASFRERMAAWLADAPGEALVGYAARFSVLTQTCQLGRHGILEEPQTEALYGLLASSFWHAGVLDDAYLASTEAAGKAPDDAATRKRYWVHQSKSQEAETGYDFGIVTPFQDGRIKLTLFQAKRPGLHHNWRRLSLTHKVRGNTGIALPESAEALSFAVTMSEVNVEYAEHGADQSAGMVLSDRRNVLTLLQAHWSEYRTQVAQMAAIKALKSWICDGHDRQYITNVLEEDKKVREDVLRRGEGSLFTRMFSYLQCDVFLATAVRGWMTPGATTLRGGWCHYVQWMNRRAGAPWSVPLERALATDGNAYEGSTPFADVLTAALSSSDDTIGLLLPREELTAFTGIISEQLPSLVWGCVASRRQIACELLYECGVAQSGCAPPIDQPPVPGPDDSHSDFGPSSNLQRP